jgi:hypothetical protein
VTESPFSLSYLRHSAQTALELLALFVRTLVNPDAEAEIPDRSSPSVGAPPPGGAPTRSPNPAQRPRNSKFSGVDAIRSTGGPFLSSILCALCSQHARHSIRWSSFHYTHSGG